MYGRRIPRYLLSLCHNEYIAEDIMQETFLRAYLYFEDCPANGIRPWLFRVAYNAYMDFIRKDRRSFSQDNEFFNNIADNKTTENKVLMQEKLKEINYFIDRLPENQKQAILLCDFNGLSYKEASEIMNISLSYFKVLLFRARQNIRNKVERNDIFE
ncbi:sigma-70 family RNA polymerase sigma factor [Clostridium tetanomorphum]|uniref:sigma-70 family RNA polymerase sigma factor n=1 Tax=Clostridium tetanomorphum TaxID=1553 RepID=UPI0030B82E16